MPSAPRPALSFPGMLMRSKKGRSPGLDGTGRSFPSHSTNRGALGSPNTKSSLSPLSTCGTNPCSVHIFMRTSPNKPRRGRSEQDAYGHCEDGVGGLEAVGSLLPEVPLVGALDGGDRKSVV